MAFRCSTVGTAGEETRIHACNTCTCSNRACWQLQELVKVGCDVRYLNDSYRLNGLKATATQQVSCTSTRNNSNASCGWTPGHLAGQRIRSPHLLGSCALLTQTINSGTFLRCRKCKSRQCWEASYAGNQQAGHSEWCGQGAGWYSQSCGAAEQGLLWRACSGGRRQQR